MIRPQPSTLKLSKININSSLFDPGASSHTRSRSLNSSQIRRLKYSYSPAINKTIAKHYQQQQIKLMQDLPVEKTVTSNKTRKSSSPIIAQKRKNSVHSNASHKGRTTTTPTPRSTVKTALDSASPLPAQIDTHPQSDTSPLLASQFTRQKALTVKQSIEQFNLILPPQLRPDTFPSAANMKQNYLYMRSQQKDRMVEAKIAAKREKANSILKSYHIKSIELANPLHQPKHYLISKQNAGHFYRLDPEHTPSNPLSFQEFQQINLQKIKSDRRQTRKSDSLNKKRPMTARPLRNEEFAPSPWKNEEKVTEQLQN